MDIITDISKVYTELYAWNNLTFTDQLYEIPMNDRDKRVKELLEMFELYDGYH